MLYTRILQLFRKSRLICSINPFVLYKTEYINDIVFHLSNFFSIINQTFFFFTKNEDIEISTQGQIVLEMDLLLWKNNYNQS